MRNHPSGNLKPSTADMRMVHNLKNGFQPMGISVTAIIINLNSGQYLIFDENGSTVERAYLCAKPCAKYVPDQVVISVKKWAKLTSLNK